MCSNFTQMSKNVPTRWGEFTLLKSDTIIRESLERYGEWAQIEIELCSSLLKEGQSVVVVGANIGIQTVAYSQKVTSTGHVYSFEPQPIVFDLLKANCDRNSPNNVSLYQVGLGDRSHTAYIENLDYSKPYNFGAVKIEETTQTSTDYLRVEVERLDNFEIGSCRLITIDCEGMEDAILHGAEKTILEHKPCLYIESNSLEQARNLKNTLTEFGYTCFLHAAPYWNPRNFNKTSAPYDMQFAREFAIIGIPPNGEEEYEILRKLENIHYIQDVDSIAKIMFERTSQRIQLYWSGETGKMNENDSYVWAYPTDGIQTKFSANINGVLGSQIRIDPCSSPSLFSIRNICLKYKNESGNFSSIIDIPDIHSLYNCAYFSKIEYLPTMFGDMLLGISNDARFYLDIPQGYRHLSGSWIFEIEITWTLSAFASGALKQNASRPKPFLNHENQGADISELDASLHSLEAISTSLDFVKSEINDIKLAQDRNYIQHDKNILALNELSAQNSSFEKRIAEYEERLATYYKFSTECFNNLEHSLVRELQTLSNRFSEEQSNHKHLVASSILGQDHIGCSTGGNHNMALFKENDVPYEPEKAQKRHPVSDQSSLTKLCRRTTKARCLFLNFRERRAIRLIKKSGLFDPDFYLDRYPDVVASGMDPVVHFVKHGSQEVRRPSELFDTAFYLSTYPDVQSSKMNPLVHYILHGKKESRLIRPQRIDVEDIQDSSTDQADSCDDDIRYLSIDVLEESIIESLSHRNYVIAFSHDDYTKSVGGVQAHMLDEQDTFSGKQVSYVQLHPYSTQSSVAPPGQSVPLSIIVDGQKLGQIDSKNLSDLASALVANSTISCSGIIIHHLLGWDLDGASEFIRSMGTSLVVWLHDYFMICPQYNLLRNDRFFCNNPDIESNACTICNYGTLRKRDLPRFRNFLNEFNPSLLTPSEASKDIWCSEFKDFEDNVLIVPHLQFQHNDSNTRPLSKFSDNTLRPKIAYLGYPFPKKGWLTWRDFVDSKIDTSCSYSCYHFGNGNAQAREKFVKVNVTRDDRYAMVNALTKYDIDIAFIWSTWPETYSYVMYEANAAGCFILTNKNSGNIAREVERNNWGKVFNSSEELFEYLANKNLVASDLIEFRKNTSTAKTMTPSIFTPDFLIPTI